MTNKEFRYTGDFPPTNVLEEFPNWEYALDEEGDQGQDETTIRPAVEQTFIGPSAAYVSGSAIQADGTRIIVMLALIREAIQGVTALLNNEWSWEIQKIGQPAVWRSNTFDWIPAESRPPSVSLSDANIFPLTVESTVPLMRGERLRTVISRITDKV